MKYLLQSIIIEIIVYKFIKPICKNSELNYSAPNQVVKLKPHKKIYKCISCPLIISIKGFNIIVIPLLLFLSSWISLGHATFHMGSHACLVASLLAAVGAHSTVYPA